LIESKYFTIDDIKNKEILAKYYFKSDGKNYCLLKLYSFAQALNGNRVAGSIYGVGFISDKNIQLTKENLALLQDAKNTFAKLSLDGLKFNKSNFSDDTDRIWKAIVHNEKGNLLNTLSLTPQINNGNAGQIAFYVKDLFALFRFIFIFSFFVIYAPNYMGHPDNYIMADPFQTPKHIEGRRCT
jgi:hypothetical protein